MVSTHSRPKTAGCAKTLPPSRSFLFQHTAARRRLAMARRDIKKNWRFNTQPPEDGWAMQAQLDKLTAVSTHSRPKTAGCNNA